MSFRLRAMLDDQTASVASPLSDKMNAVDALHLQDPKDWLAIPGVPNSAALLNSNIWGTSAEDGIDFNLEYMDLDEFLMETGLDISETTFGSTSDVPACTSPPLLTKPTAVVTTSKLEELLLAEHCVVQPAAATPASPDVYLNSASQEVSCDASDHEPTYVKKRKYSADGEGLSEAAVVIVPGTDGFDPAKAKFKPEELQPQPIIKKSKKIYVADTNKDEKYWKRRNKNNVAAKRSREARRAKENQIILRASFLEERNEMLTKENARLKAENEELREINKQLKATL